MFDPDPRFGKNQRYCSRTDCQKARKREYQREFRKEHPSEGRGRRLREALAAAEEGKPPPRHRPREPLEAVPWDEIGGEVGTSHVVVLTCLMDVVVWWVRRFQMPPRSITTEDSA